MKIFAGTEGCLFLFDGVVNSLKDASIIWTTLMENVPDSRQLGDLQFIVLM